MTRTKCQEFGAKEMRRWWREKDFSKILHETSITAEKDMENIVKDIYDTLLNTDKF